MFDLTITGNFACFTRPYTNSSPVSYEALTPPAAQGILTAIYWHPGLVWQIHEISILNPIQYESILYNMPNFRAPKNDQKNMALPKLLCKDAVELSIYCIKNTIKNSWKLYMERVDNMYYNDRYRIFFN